MTAFVAVQVVVFPTGRWGSTVTTVVTVQVVVAGDQP